MEASRVHKAWFFLRALPAILRAAGRLWWRRARRLDLQVEDLRRVDRTLPEGLHNPAWLAASVDRWLVVLPPFGYGRCLKRSLLLLDLWSRCGLDPVLHLGTRRVDGATGTDPADGSGRRFHAWLTTSDGGPWTASQGHVEIWRG